MPALAPGCLAGASRFSQWLSPPGLPSAPALPLPAAPLPFHPRHAGSPLPSVPLLRFQRIPIQEAHPDSVRYLCVRCLVAYVCVVFAHRVYPGLRSFPHGTTLFDAKHKRRIRGLRSLRRRLPQGQAQEPQLPKEDPVRVPQAAGPDTAAQPGPVCSDPQGRARQGGSHRYVWGAQGGGGGRGASTHDLGGPDDDGFLSLPRPTLRALPLCLRKGCRRCCCHLSTVGRPALGSSTWDTRTRCCAAAFALVAATSDRRLADRLPAVFVSPAQEGEGADAAAVPRPANDNLDGSRPATAASDTEPEPEGDEMMEDDTSEGDVEPEDDSVVNSPDADTGHTGPPLVLGPGAATASPTSAPPNASVPGGPAQLPSGGAGGAGAVPSAGIYHQPPQQHHQPPHKRRERQRSAPAAPAGESRRQVPTAVLSPSAPSAPLLLAVQAPLLWPHERRRRRRSEHGHGRRRHRHRLLPAVHWGGGRRCRRRRHRRQRGKRRRRRSAGAEQPAGHPWEHCQPQGEEQRLRLWCVSIRFLAVEGFSEEVFGWGTGPAGGLLLELVCAVVSTRGLRTRPAWRRSPMDCLLRPRLLLLPISELQSGKEALLVYARALWMTRCGEAAANVPFPPTDCPRLLLDWHVGSNSPHEDNGGNGKSS